MLQFGNDWDDILKDEFSKEYIANLNEFLTVEYKTYNIFPKKDNIYNALKMTARKDIRVVILGQDPYHGFGQAHGLCFSVLPGVKLPPSLVNIFKELNQDLGIETPKCGELTNWAKNGVLLLNTILTVREGCPASHKNKGWETLTNFIISSINERKRPVVFLLWGNLAQKKAELITSEQHLILKAPHPSPLSAFNGFFGCRHFSKTNEFYNDLGLEPVNWNLK